MIERSTPDELTVYFATGAERVQAAIDRLVRLDALELELTGGCGACGLEAHQMRMCCGRCICAPHDTCTRKARRYRKSVQAVAAQPRTVDESRTS